MAVHSIMLTLFGASALYAVKHEAKSKPGDGGGTGAELDLTDAADILK